MGARRTVRQLVAWEGVVHLGALFLETADVASPACD